MAVLAVGGEVVGDAGQARHRHDQRHVGQEDRAREGAAREHGPAAPGPGWSCQDGHARFSRRKKCGKSMLRLTCRRRSSAAEGDSMQGKIALEEHFAIPETLANSRGYFPDRVWQEVKSRVIDLHERRLKLMDANGIETMLLSLNAPAVQAMHRHGHGARDGARAPTIISPRSGQASRPLSGARRARRCRTRIGGAASSNAASRNSASAARW